MPEKAGVQIEAARPEPCTADAAVKEERFNKLMGVSARSRGKGQDDIFLMTESADAGLDCR